MKKISMIPVLLVTWIGLTACGNLIPTQPVSPTDVPQVTVGLPTATQVPGETQAPTEPPGATAAPDASATPETGEPSAITNRTWMWLRTQMNDGSVTTPVQPDAFTLILGPDGTVQGTTDCNSFFGSYTMEEGSLLSFGPFGTTKMFCEASQEGVFLSSLGEVQSFLVVDNQLVLEIKFDSGQIIFEEVGSPAGK